MTSMVGGVLALVFAMLMLLTGFCGQGGDLVRFFEERATAGSMWKRWPLPRRGRFPQTTSANM